MSKNKRLPIIRPEDFKSLKHYLYIYNASTETELLPSEQGELMEFLEKGIRVRMPDRICQVGHHVVVYIVDEDEHKKIKKFSDIFKLPEDRAFAGKVTEYEKIETGGGNSRAVRIDFHEFTKKQWEKLKASYVDRQKQIDSLVKIVGD